jgi:hypothetical protein
VTLDPVKLASKGLFATSLASAAGQLNGKPMVNQDVIALRTAGLSDDVIIVKIEGSPAEYKLDTGDLIDLKKANAPESVIQTMMEAQVRTR